MEELVAGPGGLLSRGLLEDHAISYGALRRTKQQRAALAGSLNDRAEFERQQLLFPAELVVAQA